MGDENGMDEETRPREKEKKEKKKKKKKKEEETEKKKKKKKGVERKDKDEVEAEGRDDAADEPEKGVAGAGLRHEEERRVGTPASVSKHTKMPKPIAKAPGTGKKRKKSRWTEEQKEAARAEREAI